jgi:hypothetical protein
MPDVHLRGAEHDQAVRRGARHQPDRRRRPTPMLSRFLFWGRRRRGRRADEQSRIYVDRPGGWVIAACVALISLSIADAYVTLLILSEGGMEVNPVMRAVLGLGHRPFVIVKIALTVAGAAVLCLHKTWPLGRLCLWVALGGYGLLTAYHLIVHATRAWTP